MKNVWKLMKIIGITLSHKKKKKKKEATLLVASFLLKGKILYIKINN